LSELRHDFAFGTGREAPEEGEADVLADEADGAVGEGEVGSPSCPLMLPWRYTRNVSFPQIQFPHDQRFSIDLGLRFQMSFIHKVAGGAECDLPYEVEEEPSE